MRLNIDEAHTFRADDSDNENVRAILPNFKWVIGGIVKTLKLSWPFRSNAMNTPILLIDCEEFQPNKEILIEGYVTDGHGPPGEITIVGVP